MARRPGAADPAVAAGHSPGFRRWSVRARRPVSRFSAGVPRAGRRRSPFTGLPIHLRDDYVRRAATQPETLLSGSIPGKPELSHLQSGGGLDGAHTGESQALVKRDCRTIVGTGTHQDVPAGDEVGQEMSEQP